MLTNLKEQWFTESQPLKRLQTDLMKSVCRFAAYLTCQWAFITELSARTLPDNACSLQNSLQTALYRVMILEEGGTPYELGFISKRDAQHTDDGIEDMAFLLGPDSGTLYQRRHASAEFDPAYRWNSVLRDNLNGTFTLTVASQGEFLFNSE